MKIFTRLNVLRVIFTLVMIGALTILGLAVAACLSGCATATIDEPAACDTVMLGSVPASPVAGIPLPPQTFTSNFDFSDTIKKVSDVADSLTTNISQLTMNNNGDLQWVSSVDVSIAADGMNPQKLASYVSNGDPGQVVTMNILMDSGTILSYLQHPVTLTFTVNGTAPTQTVNFTNTMCVDVGGHVSKSL